MKNLEKLAREICWCEFSPPRTSKRIGKTKSKYWNDIGPEKRKEYERDAKFLMWCMRNLPTDMLASDYAPPPYTTGEQRG